MESDYNYYQKIKNIPFKILFYADEYELLTFNNTKYLYRKFINTYNNNKYLNIDFKYNYFPIPVGYQLSYIGNKQVYLIDIKDKLPKRSNFCILKIIGPAEINNNNQLNVINDEEYVLSNFNKNDCKKKQHCFTKKNTYGSCGLILPKTNLYNGSNNKEFYFTKLADQIIRYEKIRKYIFTPRAFLSFQSINYKINENEVVVLEEIFLDQYLKDITLREKNNYIKTNKIYFPFRAKSNIPPAKYKDAQISNLTV